jgi:hypothetical protein
VTFGVDEERREQRRVWAAKFLVKQIKKLGCLEEDVDDIDALLSFPFRISLPNGLRFGDSRGRST